MTNEIDITDDRPHLKSMLMRESLLDKAVEASTESPVVRMLPESIVIKIGGRSIFDRGKEAVFPVVEVLKKALADDNKLIIGTGGGARTRHVFSVGLDLGMPTGVLAQLAMADALGTAHMLGALLAPVGVVAIPPEMFGHLLPLFLHSAPGVIYNGVPPIQFGSTRQKSGASRRTGPMAGVCCWPSVLAASLILVKDVDGLYDADPNQNSNARFIKEIGSSELKEMNLKTLPFDRVVLDLLDNTRLLKQIQVVNGLKPELIEAAMAGEHVGTIIHAC